MAEEKGQGWNPIIGQDGTLQEIVEEAFDYRGNVTVTKRDGSQILGYLFNRNMDVPQPYVQLFDAKGEGPFTVLYGEIAAIAFSGRDMAAGKSYDAWVRRKAMEKAGGGRPQIFPDDGE